MASSKEWKLGRSEIVREKRAEATFPKECERAKGYRIGRKERLEANERPWRGRD